MFRKDDVADTFAREWVEAWNSHDLDRILSHYSADLEFTSPLVVQRYPDLDGVIRDKELLREYFAKGLQSRPDLTFSLVGVLYSVTGFVMLYCNATGSHTTEYVEIDEKRLVRRAIACYSDSPLF